MDLAEGAARALCAGACWLAVPEAALAAAPATDASPIRAAAAHAPPVPDPGSDRGRRGPWPGVRGPLADPPIAPPAAAPAEPDPDPARAIPRLAQTPSPDAADDAPPSPTPRALECAASLRLPWGPLRSCEDAIVWGAIAATTVGGAVAWWHRGFDTRFDVANEGWFGPDTYSGGVDKLGHGFGFYVGTRLVNRTLGWAGVRPEDSLPVAASLSFGLGLGVEVLDALARGGDHGFSWQDLAADTVGTLLAVLAEAHPDFDRWFALRYRHARTGDPERTYDRQQYFAALRPSGWSALGERNPLRYVELLAGYGATGFQGDSGLAPSADRRRTIYLGLGLNLTEVLERSAFRGELGGGRTQALATELLRYVQPPGTAVVRSAYVSRP